MPAELLSEATASSSNGNANHSAEASSSTSPSIENLARLASKRARIIFSEANPSQVHAESTRARLASKFADEYAHAKELPPVLLAQQGQAGPARPDARSRKRKGPDSAASTEGQLIQELSGGSASSSKPGPADGVVALRRAEGFASANGGGTSLSPALIRKKEAAARIEKPQYHPQWKLMRVISGHLGWVRALTVEPGNKWFATGAGDRMIKVSAVALS